MANSQNITSKAAQIGQDVSDFMNAYNRSPADIRKLKGDLGSRQFWRLLYQDGKSEILMICLGKDHPNYTPGHDLEDYVRLSKLLENYGLRVPEIYEYDLKAGICLVEDIGDRTFLKALESGCSNELLTEKAGHILKKLSDLPSDTLPDFMSSHIMQGHKRFVDWFCPVLLGKKVDDAFISGFLEAWDQIFNNMPEPDQGFVYVDYHFGNLMMLEDSSAEDGFETVLLDFQGAMRGPLAYDLTNLLQDARRDVGPDLHDQVFEQRVAGFSESERENFRLWYEVLACQFHCRVIGQFIKLAYLHGKAEHLEHLPRLANYISENSSKNKILEPLRLWLQKQDIQLDGNIQVNFKKLPEWIREDAI